MQCVILAGGLGTRIDPLSDGLPKALIPVAGQPFAFHQLAWLKAQGISDVVYCIGHKGSVVRDVLANGATHGLKVSYSDEAGALRGTGGAIKLAADRGLLDTAFFVLYADSYLPIDVAPVWTTSRNGHDATMVVINNEGKWDTSNVLFEDGWVRIYDKGCLDPSEAGLRYIDYGLSVLPRSAIDEWIPADVRYDLASFYAGLSRAGVLKGHEVHQRFYEIGSPDGLRELRQHLEAGG